MSGAGRPPKPTALKLLQGTARKHRINENEPKPSRGRSVPSPPADLGKIARNEWRRVAKHLHELNLLTPLDKQVLAMYCKVVQEERELVSYLEKWNVAHADHPNLMKTAVNTFKPHPYVTQLKWTRRMISDFAREFGMTPSSRTRVSVTRLPLVNKFDKYK